MLNDRKRWAINVHMVRKLLLCSGALTFQIVFSASCNSPNMPDAPSSSVAIPKIVASMPCVFCSPAVAIMPSSACAPSRPKSPTISCAMRPCAASFPNTAPAAANTSSSSGPSDNTL